MIILSIPTAIWFVIQHNQVQTWLVAKATHIIEEKIGAKVIIEKVDFRPFNRILLRNVFIADLNQDTLFAANTLSVNLLRFNNQKKIINLYRVTVEDAKINLLTDSLGVMNLTALLDSFKSDTLKDESDPFTIKVLNARFLSTSLIMRSANAEPMDYGINFNDLHLSQINLDINYLDIIGDTISFTIADMNFLEKSGFVLDKFRSELSFSSQHMNFEKLRLTAVGSNLTVPYLRMKYSSWDDLSHFVEEVRLNGAIDKSKLNTKFLSYFASDLKNFDQSFTLAGTFKGPLSDIRVRDLDIKTGNYTSLKANINITGLPNFSNSLLIFDIKKFETHLTDIEAIKDHGTGKSLVELPDNLNTLEKITYSGNFTGFLSDFVAYGTLTSAIGNLSVDISIKPNQQQTTSFDGQISAKNLNLGKLADNNLLGRASLNASIKGSTDYGNKIDAQIDAIISSIEANDYQYTNIKVSGNLDNGTYVGTIFLDDPNIKLNFMGKVDLSDTIPVFDFSAFVPKIDLVKLNLNKSDSISQASFLLTSKFKGSNLDNSQGEVKILNCFYKNQNGEIKTSDITILANNTADSKLISVKSEFFEGELRGKYNYSNIFSSLSQLIYRYVPALSPNNIKPEIKPSGVENPEYNDYIVKLRLRKTQKLTDVLFPGFKIAENTNVFGIYNPDFQSLTLKIMIPELVVGGNTIKNISIDGQTHDTTFVASISMPQVDISGTFIRNISISASAFENNITTKLSWDNKTSVKNQGLISATAKFDHTDFQNTNRIQLVFASSNFYLNDTIWNIAPSQIIIDTSGVAIEQFVLQNKMQRLWVSGNITPNPRDSIMVELEKIDVSNLNFYTEDMGYSFAGKIDGFATITDILNNPLFFSNLTLQGLKINNQDFGQLQFRSQWFADEKKLSISAKNTLNNSVTFNAKGDIFPESNSLNFKASVDRILLQYFEPLLEGNVTDISGFITGDLSIGGTLDKPNVNGTLSVKDAAMTIDFTKTRYRISDNIFFDNSNIYFRGFRIQDINNRFATLNGSVKTDYFRNISLDLNISPNNFQFLNTMEKDNELFYGTVNATGLARVWGTPSNLNVDASIRTEPKTAIFLPLSSSSEVAEHDFVSFVNRSTDIIIIEDILGIEETQKSNLSINLDLEVTPEAEAQIIIDKQLGDIIKANGSGNLKMEVNPSKDIFNMFGEYVIEKGDYLFTLQGVINKRFRIGDGSTIIWNGDVDDANMNIKAIYSLRTPLSPLFPNQEDDKFKKRTPIDCQILLAGKLMEPTIEFNIDVPGADNQTKALVESTLNTEERISKQFLSLLVIGSFLPETTSVDQTGGQFGQGLASTASEMLSNQLSNWLSQWSNAFDIGLNYRPGDPGTELSSNEVELAISTQLFNDRVSINGNVDMGAQTSSSPIAGDFNIDVKIVPSGKLRLKAFARSNKDDILYAGTQSSYTTGAGVMYREDFNSLNELWNRYRNLFRPKAKKTEGSDIASPDVDSYFLPPDSLKNKEKPFLGIK